ncbi:MAG: isochorismatase family protein [Elusimicrobiota bacterium]
MIKEEYFTKENISSKSRKWLEKVTGRRVSRFRKNISIENSALLVIDMQKYFTKSQSHAFVKSSEAVIDNIKKLIDIFLKHHKPVIFTRHIDNLKDKNNMLLKWWRDRILKSDPLSKLDERIYFKGAVIIEKSQYDAFYNTKLENILSRKGVKSVFISGVVANLCCETTARSAFVRGYNVYFGVDSTAAYSPHHHLATLLNLSYGFAVPFLVEDLDEK